MGMCHWQARGGAGCVSVAITFLPLQVYRERVFILGYKPNFHFEVNLPGDLECDSTWQGAELDTSESFAAACRAPWNPTEEPALHEWLSPSMDSCAEQRLHMVGNIVFPKQAHFALNLIEQSLRSEIH